MKKMTIMVAAALSMLATSCGSLGNLGGVGTGSGSGTAASQGGSVLGSILGAATKGETIGNVLSSVIGLNKLSQRELVGTWKYDGPGCAFTSDNLLAKAGGEVAATTIEEKLKVQYDRLGMNSSNTYINFKEDGTFSAKIDGRGWSGKYTYDPKTGALNMKGLLLSLNGYATRNGGGISVLFESKKLLTLVQTIAAISGNSTLGTIGDLSKNYDGVRLGFDLRK